MRISVDSARLDKGTRPSTPLIQDFSPLISSQASDEAEYEMSPVQIEKKLGTGNNFDYEDDVIESIVTLQQMRKPVWNEKTNYMSNLNRPTVPLTLASLR